MTMEREVEHPRKSFGWATRDWYGLLSL